jgi:hypothetical protein
MKKKSWLIRWLEQAERMGGAIPLAGLYVSPPVWESDAEWGSREGKLGCLQPGEIGEPVAPLR